MPDTADTPDEPSVIGILGDTNGDGIADSADALAILRCSAGLEEIDETKKRLCDVNGDGAVDSADALSVLRSSAGLRTSENIGGKITS